MQSLLADPGGGCGALLDAQFEPAWVVGLSLGPWWRWSWGCNCPTRCRAGAGQRSRVLLETPKEQERCALRLAAGSCARWRGAGSRALPGPDLAWCATSSGAFRQRKRRPGAAEALPGWSVRARLGTLWQPVAIISTSHDYLPPGAAGGAVRLPAHRHHPLTPMVTDTWPRKSHWFNWRIQPIEGADSRRKSRTLVHFVAVQGPPDPA